MELLLQHLKKEKGFYETLTAIDSGGCPAVLSGLGGIHRAHAAAALSYFTEMPLVAVCPDENDARKTAEDLSAFLGIDKVPVITARELTFHDAESVSRASEHERIFALHRLREGKLRACVITADGLIQRTMPPETMDGASMTLRCGEQYDLAEITAMLTSAGYVRAVQVEGVGQFALRGGILDFWSPAHTQPIRCEFFGDDIDSMGFFDVSSQRRTENADFAEILPACECAPSLAYGGETELIEKLRFLIKRAERRKDADALIKTLERDIARIDEKRTMPSADKYMALIYPVLACAADYIPPDALVCLCEPPRLGERAENFAWQLGEDTSTLIERGELDGQLAVFMKTWEEACERLAENAVVMLDNFTTGRYPLKVRTLSAVTAKQLPSYGGSIDTAADDISHYIKQGFSTIVLCQDKRRADGLCKILAERGITAALDFALNTMPAPGTCTVSVGGLMSGIEYPDSRLAVITEGQMLRQSLRHKVKKKAVSNRQKLESYSDLAPGDIVVHETYGIGRFVGIFRMPVDKVEKDYIKIAFAGTDSLYVPATSLDKVSKYIGAGEDKPVKLSKMGGTDWARAKTRAKGAAKELAKGLIALQAERRRLAGHAFAPDSQWQREFEDAFGYQETDDQLRSIREIKEDMERAVPMDRLLCGDVGYGKTEVALRAVMKCIMDNHQAAILVPTTVLAQQHYQTAIKRFAGFPVKIEMLSRFKTGAELKKALKDMETGACDIVIGTHKLLGKDIKFKRLGLLVVDEEQRFGVQHKERLKEMAKQVDVLTLSATPIPRTLNMALSGLRDMSAIEEPPQDRQPVQTYVLEHDWSVVCDAIRRETGRGGQVYYIHNRVENIDRVAARLNEMLDGQVTIGVGHGKMDEDMLGSVMEKVASGDIQVLVCTTIIETGIDIPNVNTLIIEDADKLGLAQLHQIRGRVGRSSRKAYAYLTFRPGRVLSEIATKRLSAIREFAEFNSGFKIAMRDLEIRGAGDLLGAEQSGHMMSVGYDMYLKLLEEAVLEEKGEKPQVSAECSADLAVAAGIPEEYIASAEQRMDLYRRIAHIRSEDDADDITDELIDRFGEPPRQVNTLIHVALMRGEASNAGITDISQKGGVLRFKLGDFSLERISELYSRPEYRGLVKIEAGTAPSVSLKLKAGKNILTQAVGFIRAYAETGKETK